MARRAATTRTLGRVAKDVFKLEGIEQLQNNIEDILDATTGAEMKDVYVRAAGILADEARDLAPVRTGRLRKAIFAGRGDPKKSNALVGVNYSIAPHAHLVEFGTVKWKGHPFMRPAISATKGAVAAAIIQGFQDILKRHGQ